MRKKNNPNELTTREKSILEFIRQKIWDSGFPPTVREIGEAVGLRSTSTVHNYLKRLELKGAIRKNPDSSRAIEVVADTWRRKKMIPMPLVGAVRAGEPITADEHTESVYPLPAELIGKDNNCFMLIVRVKRFYKEEDHIRLQPENDEYQPIIAKEVIIRGKVIGLYRHM